ncbi:hypothetical protein NDU88_000882, partial [Pleurodeles waltl]
ARSNGRTAEKRGAGGAKEGHPRTGCEMRARGRQSLEIPTLRGPEEISRSEKPRVYDRAKRCAEEPRRAVPGRAAGREHRAACPAARD